MIINNSLMSDDIINSALKHYPDLKQVQVKIVCKSISTTMQARPYISNIYRSKNDRKYLIIANNKKQNRGGILIHEAPTEAATGILSHELAHIQDYQQKTNIQLIVLGLKYLFANFRRNYEKQIDLLTIKHGAGEYLLAYTNHIIESPNTSEAYRKKIKKYYLGPEEIRQAMEVGNNG